MRCVRGGDDPAAAGFAGEVDNWGPEMEPCAGSDGPLGDRDNNAKRIDDRFVWKVQCSDDVARQHRLELARRVPVEQLSPCSSEVCLIEVTLEGCQLGIGTSDNEGTTATVGDPEFAA